MDRRRFLLVSAASATLAGCSKLSFLEQPPAIQYPGMQDGHWLRDGQPLPAPSGELVTDVAILGSDGAQDVHPSGVEGITEPIHALVLASMGMPIFDNLDLEAVSKEAAKRNRWEFLVTAAPVPVQGETGSVLNPIATF